MERFLTWAVVAGIIILGLWAADRNKQERAENPTQYSTPFMRCMSLSGYREKSDCLEREGLGSMMTDDPTEEPRRR